VDPRIQNPDRTAVLIRIGADRILRILRRLRESEKWF
jgi:hypothetical protein